MSWSWSKAFVERAAAESNSAFKGGLGASLNKQRQGAVAILGHCLLAGFLVSWFLVPRI